MKTWCCLQESEKFNGISWWHAYSWIRWRWQWPWHSSRAFLTVTTANELTIGFDKVEYTVRKAQFLETNKTTNCHHPTNDTIRAIQEMEQSLDMKSLWSFIGMADYFNKDGQWLAVLSASLCELIQKDAHFSWEPEHTQAFITIKTEISRAPIL